MFTVFTGWSEPTEASADGKTTTVKPVNKCLDEEPQAAKWKTKGLIN